MIICTGDWHIRPDKPACRKETAEEWIEVQFKKIEAILKYSAENDSAPILVAGDFFHKPTGAPAWLLARLIRVIDNGYSEGAGSIYVVAGQHDLPFHQLENLHRSNLGVLLAAEVVFARCHSGMMNAKFFPWGKPIEEVNSKNPIAIAHTMVLKDQQSELWPGQIKDTGVSAAEHLLRKFSCYDLIATGDNHQPFAVEFGGRWLCNAGSLTRQKSNETHIPGFWVCDEGRVDRVDLPYDPDAIQSAATKEASAAWAGNLEAVGALLDEMDVADELDFYTALQAYFRARKVRADVQKKIMGE